MQDEAKDDKSTKSGDGGQMEIKISKDAPREDNSSGESSLGIDNEAFKETIA